MLNANARKLEVEEDEEDIKERERLRAEMALHGIEDSGNKWPPRPSLTTEDSTNAETGHSPLPASPLPQPIPETDGLEASPILVEQLKSMEAKEKEAKLELVQGRASGFTEPRPRRHRPGSMRSSRSSSSQGASSTVGLGPFDQGRITPEGSPQAATVTPSTTPGSVREVQPAEVDENEAGWTKRLKRISLGWGSPSPALAPAPVLAPPSNT